MSDAEQAQNQYAYAAQHGAPQHGAPKKARRLPWILAAIVMMLLVGAAGSAFLYMRSERAKSTVSPSVKAVGPASPYVDAPSGWYVSPDRLSAARSAEDVSATSPVGAFVRVRVTPTTGDATALIEQARENNITVAAGASPEVTRIDGEDAVRIRMFDGSSGRYYEYITVSLDRGRSVLFIASWPDGTADSELSAIRSSPRISH